MILTTSFFPSVVLLWRALSEPLKAPIGATTFDFAFQTAQIWSVCFHLVDGVAVLVRAQTTVQVL